jgi:hypothetical protein
MNKKQIKNIFIIFEKVPGKAETLSKRNGVTPPHHNAI